MEVVKKHTEMLYKLQKQVQTLERKEKATHRKLQLALAKVKKVAKTHEKRLVKKTRDAKMRAEMLEAAIYKKLAASIRKHTQDVKKARKVLGQKVAIKKRVHILSKKSKKIRGKV